MVTSGCQIKSRPDEMRVCVISAILVLIFTVSQALENDNCPCLNGGACVKGTMLCRCKNTWTGDRCEISVCGECQNGGTCRKGGNCKCPTGYIGDHCQMKCPCQNGGRCVPKPLGCRCPYGVFGKICEFPCPCKNGGRCETATSVGECDNLGLGFTNCRQFDATCKCKTEWTGERCDVSACQCKNGGTCVGKRCVCPRGFVGEKCEIKIKCCNLYGDPHLMTFDGARMDWQGDCRYNVMSLCPCVPRPTGIPSFSVHTKNSRNGRTRKRVSWVRTVDVYIDGARITLDRKRRVRINGVNSTLPKHVKNSVVSDDGAYVRIDTKFGASVAYDGVHRATVCVPESWMGKTCGICGNFDGDRVNDYVTRDGDHLDHIRRLKSRAPLVAGSWRVMDRPGEVCEEEPLYEDPPESDTWRDLALSREYCGMVTQTPFLKCKKAMAPSKVEEYMQACVFDVMEMAPDSGKVKEMACENLNALAAECAEMNQAANITWRQITGCEYQCAVGMTYKEKMSPCVATCAKPDAPTSCTVTESEGCACPEGTLLSGGKCVKPDECGCTDDKGNYYEMRETFYSENCSVKFRCTPGTADKASFLETLPGCAASEVCWAENGVQTCKKPPVNGDWSEWGDWSTCGPLAGHEGIVQMRTRTCNNPPPQNGGTCSGRSMEVQQCLPGDY